MATRHHFNRRDFLKRMGLGLAGAAAIGKGLPLLGGGRSALEYPAQAAGTPASPAAQAVSGDLYRSPVPPATVSLLKGDNRYDLVMRSLKAIEDEVLASIQGKKILLKPNIVLSKCELCCTHPDAVRAVLDFLSPHVKDRITIGESGNQNTEEGFRNYGYYKFEKEYNVKVIDLNHDTFQYRYCLGLENKPHPIRIISSFLDKDTYLISLARMKTHNYVLVTLSLKNVLLAAPLNDYKQNDKGFMHMAPAAVNDLCHYNMFHLAQDVWPDLAIIDGFEGMEGNGPAWGSPIMSKVALASLDPLAADTVATKIMGFDPKRVNYLTAMAEGGMGQGDFGKIRLLGTPIEQCLTKYKPNEKMAELYKL
jgi:uncharacterized protein (DUF362 family)